MWNGFTAPMVFLAALFCAMAAGCGNIARHSDSGLLHPQVNTPRRGGDLVVLSPIVIRNVDPARASTQGELQLAYATQRPLYSYQPDSSSPVPDLASGPAEISQDARTVTVHLRRGVRFSPPVDREVTSADVAYAIERGANPNVHCPYFRRYFSDIVGAETARGRSIPGIVTPDSRTIVFHLDKPWGREFADALALPLSAPVPPELALADDRAHPSRYENQLASTGPYMIAARRAGRVLGSGREPGRSIFLVRNPSWRAGTDFRPAYLNRITFRFGGDPKALGREVLSGSQLVESSTPLETAELAQRDYPRQLVISPFDGVDYIAVNNSDVPFANEILRQALWAALDRTALVRAMGGPLLAQPAIHFIYPGMPGSKVADSIISTSEMPYLAHSGGDMQLARSLMKSAGYSGGGYTGPNQIDVIGTAFGPQRTISRLVNTALVALGYRTRLQLLPQNSMQEKCARPNGQPKVCPDGLLKPMLDDGQALVYEAFDGHRIAKGYNENWGEVNEPNLTSAIERESALIEGASREQGFGAVDNGLVRKAVGIPYAWVREASIESSDVAGVADAFNGADWDLSFSYIKAR